MNRSLRLLAATGTAGALLGWSLSRTVTSNSYKGLLTALAAEREKLQRALARQERETKNVRDQRDYAHLLLRRVRQDGVIPYMLSHTIGITVQMLTDEGTARAEQAARDLYLAETPFTFGKFFPPGTTLFPQNLFPAGWREQQRQAIRALAAVYPFIAVRNASAASTSEEGAS